MKNFFLNIHKGQSGIIISALIAVVFTLLSAGWAWWWIRDTVVTPGEQLPWEDAYEDRAVGWEWVSFGCTAGDSTGNTINGLFGTIFESPYTMQIESYDFRVAYKDYVDDTYLIASIYEYDGGACLGDLVGHSERKYLDDLGAPCYPCNMPWATFYFAEPYPYLFDGTTYVIILSKSGTGDHWANLKGGSSCLGDITKGYYTAGCYLTEHMDYLVKGYATVDPQVDTIGHVINLDGSVTVRGVVENLGNMEAGFYVDPDYDVVAAGTGIEYEWGTTGYAPGRVPIDYRLTQISTNVTYYYCAYAKAWSNTWYGSVKNFTRGYPDFPILLTCSVTSNTIDGVQFESAAGGLVDGVTYNLSIEYGRNVSDCHAVNGSIAVATGVTEDGVWQTISETGDDFEGGLTYFYRLAAYGDDDSISYSTTQQFVPWDQDEVPGIMRIILWINDTLGSSLEPAQFWWLLIALAFGLVWILAAYTRWKWLGVIGSALIFIALVAFSKVPIWIVILAVLIAGWIIFKLVFTRAHEETGD